MCVLIRLRIAHSHKPALFARRGPKPAGAVAHANRFACAGVDAPLCVEHAALLDPAEAESCVWRRASPRRGLLSLIGLLGSRNAPQGRAGAASP